MTKPVIVKRSVKGSALTFTELDANFQNLDDATITLKAGSGGTDVVSDLNGVITLVATDGLTLTGNNTSKEIAIDASLVRDTTPQLGGNLDVQTFKITTSVSNGDVTIEPNGVGDVLLKGDTVIVGDVNNAAFITSNGTGDLQLSTNNGTNSGTITIINGLNGNIGIEPSGTGDIFLTADTVTVGDTGAAATLTTNGAGNLTLSTNAGTNSGTIAIAQGTNGNITVTPNGTGLLLVSGQTVGVRTNNTGGVIIGRAQTTTSGAYQYPSFTVQKARTDILTAAMTLEPAVIGFQVRDSASVNTTFGRLACTYQGTGTNPFYRFLVSADGFTTSVDCVTFGGGVANWGSSSTYTHTTTGTTDLILSTNGGTNSGTITIKDGVNGNIQLIPNGTGSVFIENSSGTDIADFNTSRVLTNVAIRGNVASSISLSKGATYTIGTEEKQYIEVEITNTGSGTSVTVDVTALTVSGTGGHYAVLIYNNSGSNMDLDILNNGVTLSTASKNMPNGSRHICTIYCVGNYAAVEVMDAV